MKFNYSARRSTGNHPDIFKDFPGFINKIQELFRTAKKSMTFPGCGNPGWPCVILIKKV